MQALTMGERPQGLSPASLGLHAHQRLGGMEAWTRQAPPGAARLPGPTEPGLVTAKVRASSLQGPVPSAHPPIGGLRNVLSVFVFNFDHVSHSDTFTRFLIKKVQKG